MATAIKTKQSLEARFAQIFQKMTKIFLEYFFELSLLFSNSKPYLAGIVLYF